MVFQQLPREQVEWVARLAYIAIDEAEIAKYAEDLSAVLSYVNELGQVDTSAVDDIVQIAGSRNVMAADVAVPSPISRSQFLERAPASKRGYIKVKSVFKDRS